VEIVALRTLWAARCPRCRGAQLWDRELSRAYERTRGLAWVLSDTPAIEDTPTDD
jgi:hypothetical protein